MDSILNEVNSNYVPLATPTWHLSSLPLAYPFLEFVRARLRLPLTLTNYNPIRQHNGS